MQTFIFTSDLLVYFGYLRLHFFRDNEQRRTALTKINKLSPQKISSFLKHIQKYGFLKL